MSKNFTKKYEIHYYEVDAKLRCKLSSIIDFIGDIGTQQSESLGGGIEFCARNSCAWVFYKDDIKIYRYPIFGETITINTQPIGFKKFYGLRKYTIMDAKNNLIGEASALFFLIDINKRRPTRIQEEQYEMYGVDGDVDYDISMDRIEKLDHGQYNKQFNIRYSDIDSNNHVNNVKYVEWAIEAVPLEVINNYSIRRIKIIFEKETVYGESILSSATVNKIDDSNLKSYHTIKNADGTEVTVLEVEWEKSQED